MTSQDCSLERVWRLDIGRDTPRVRATGMFICQLPQEYWSKASRASTSNQRSRVRILPAAATRRNKTESPNIDARFRHVQETEAAAVLFQWFPSGDRENLRGVGPVQGRPKGE